MRTIQGFVFAALVAAGLVNVGTHDFECYENAFVSLNRGTEMAAVTVAGQPVYTLALGLGTRLPLHGNLGASPAAALARVLPAPVTHWLLLALSMTPAALLVLRAIEPSAGRLVAWWTVTLLFASLPMVAYTVHNDWPETAVTYCALVGGVFAPHAWIATRETRFGRRRRFDTIGLLAVVASLFAMAHPGYWSQLAVATGLSGLLLFLRPVGQPHDRWTAVLGVGAAALAGVAIHLPDLMRELTLSAGLGRDAQVAAKNLIEPHLFPLGTPGSKDPFMLLPLTIAALAAASAIDRRWRALVAGCAAASLSFGLAAAYLKVGALTLGSLAPTASWTLRDPAGVFAVMGGAFAVAALLGNSRDGRSWGWTRNGILLLMGLASAQALGYAGAPLWQMQSRFVPWNHDGSNPGERTQSRGMPARVAATGDRLALWPGVRSEMRLSGRASTDWADAGQTLVTAWTKNRTTAGLVGPNGYVFDQALDLGRDVLCDPPTVSFLRLRHLIVPPRQACDGWVLTPARIDGRWALATWVGGEDPRVRAIPAASLTKAIRGQPALAGPSALMHQLVPQDGSILEIDTRRNALLIGGVGRTATTAEQILVLPVAYDPGWQVSSGRTLDVAGLLGIADAREADVRGWFAPDAALWVRGGGMAAAQVLGVLGLLALAFGSVRRPKHNVA